MAIIHRITQLFRADINAVLDRLEEPESLLKEAIREMEKSLEKDARKLSELEQEQSGNIERLRATEQNLHKIEEELNLCFEQNNESLARKLVKQKLETQRFSQLISQRHKQLELAIQNINSVLANNNDELSLIKQKLTIFTQSNNQSMPRQHFPGNDIFINDDEVEIAFIKEKQRRVTS